MKLPSEWVVRHRWPIIAFFLLFTALFAVRLPELEIDPEIKNQLPDDMASRRNVQAIEARFGGSEMVMVVLTADDVLAPTTLERVRRIGEELAEVPTITRVISPFTLTDIRGSADGMMSVEEAIPSIPETDAERDALRARLTANDFIYGNVVARDFTAVSVIGMLSAEASDAETLAAIEDVVARVPGPEEVVLGGMPVVREQVSEDIRSDIRRFAPVSFVVIVSLLFLTLRQIRGVTVPFAVQILSTIVAMGLIPMLGWKVQMVTVILPVIILAVGNDHAIHLIARYQEENLPGTAHTADSLVVRVLDELGVPVIAAGITTVAGFLCLLTHIVVPAAQLGVLAAFGVSFAILASLLFVPAVLAALPVPKPIPGMGGAEGAGVLDRVLRWNARFVTRRPRAVVVGTVLLALLATAGLPLLKVDTNPVNYYPSNAPVARTSALINRHFGGSTELAVLIEADVKDPAVLAEIDRIERELQEMPQVGYTMSIARVVRKMNRAVNGDDPAADRIPDSRELVAQLFLLHSLGGSPEDFERLVDFDYEHALITARIDSTSTEDIAAVVSALEADVARSFPGKGIVGGFGAVFAELVDAVVGGQVSSLVLSLVIVALQVAVCFWSISAGLWSMIPLIIAVPMLFGLMGWSGIELNVVTAMLSSILIGVGVDYTIHFLWRFREERRAGASPEEAAFRTLTTVGRGIVFNAASVMAGFAVLLLSNFLPVRFFGFLVVVSIAGCLVAALVLMPPLVLLLEPRFGRVATTSADDQPADELSAG